MSMSRSDCIFLTWNLLSFLNILVDIVGFLHQIWDFGVIFFSKYSFCPFLSSTFGDTIIHVLVHLIVSHVSLRLCLFFFIIFLFFWREDLSSFSGLLIVISVSSNLLLNPSSKFFILVVFCVPQCISYQVFYRASFMGKHTGQLHRALCSEESCTWFNVLLSYNQN